MKGVPSSPIMLYKRVRGWTSGRSPGGILPYKDLMGTCGQPGYVFRDFCLKQGIDFIIFVLIRVSIVSVFVLNRVSFLGR